MPKVPKVLAVMGEATIKINAQLPRTAQLTVEMHRARATVERMAKALEDLLALHDHEVFVKQPWEESFAETRAALAAYKGESHE